LSGIPLLHFSSSQMVHDTTIIIVPADLHKFVAVMSQNRVCPPRERRVETAWVACSMSRNTNPRQGFIGFRIQFFKDRGYVETIDKKCRAACAFSVGQKMEELESTWVSLLMDSYDAVTTRLSACVRNKCCRYAPQAQGLYRLCRLWQNQL
jgi:hypothetical protein